MKAMTRPVSDINTKTALLSCAEKLFFAKGFENVSIRAITDAAGANVAAINYHFGGKTKLYRDVLKRRFAEIARKKVTLIQDLHRDGQQPDLRRIIANYVRSHFDEILCESDGEHLLQIIYREMSPGAVAADLVTTELVTPINQALTASIRSACPELSDQHISRCISSITGQVLHFIRFREVIQAVSGSGGPDFVDDVCEHITAFSLRGIGSEPHA